MPSKIYLETELTREGLEGLRTDIDRLLEGIRPPISPGGASEPGWQVPTLAEQRVNQLWPRLGENLRKLVASFATDFDHGKWVTFEDLAERLNVEPATVKSWHRNLSRSLKRVDREVGSEPPLLESEWSDAEWRMHYRMPEPIRTAVLAKL